MFREQQGLGDSRTDPEDRPRPVLPLPYHRPNTKFSDQVSFLPFINDFNRFNNVPLHG